MPGVSMYWPIESYYVCWTLNLGHGDFRPEANSHRDLVSLHTRSALHSSVGNARLIMEKLEN